MKKKITQILYPGLGGHSSVAFSIIEGDKHKEFSHSLIGYGIETPSSNVIVKAQEMNIDFISILKKRGLDLNSQLLIYRLLKVDKPDLIIMHSTSLIFIVWWFSLWNKVKWCAVEHQPNYAKTRIDWIYSFFIFLLAHNVVLLTDQYKDEIKEKFSFFNSRKRVFIINNGINVSRFIPEKRFRNDEIVFSMASRMNIMRDHDTLIRSFCEVLNVYKSKLYIAGAGDTLNVLKELVKQLGIENEVVFTGSLDENELVKLIHKTDIYIHSSLSETLSTSLLQVMACQVPIIATNIPGINNLLNDNEDAILFEPKNISSLTSKITYLIENPLIANQLKEEAFQKVLLNYDSEVMFKKYSNILK